jgi:septation ring formation regulator EzrA
MSTDRTTEILNYLSAISREVGELRTDMNARFSEVNTRLERLEAEVTRIGREQRLQGRRLDRIESLLLTTRADIDELQERVDTLEGK